MTKQLVFRGVDGFPHPTHAENDANFDRLMYWAGDWAAGSYQRFEVVEHRGNVWNCELDTTEEPTLTGTDWKPLTQGTMELWQATPILGMDNETIQWTFVPIYSGQVPIILTEASGVFTFATIGAAVDFQLTSHVSFEYAANNSEADYSITGTYVGAGVSTLLPIIDADSSPRAGSFGRTALELGTVVAAAITDTVSFLADSGGTNGSDVDLVNAFLQVTGPTP
jgi:hypothetical protein